VIVYVPPKLVEALTCELPRAPPYKLDIGVCYMDISISFNP